MAENEIEDLFFEPGEVIFDTEKPLTTAYFILEGSVNLKLTLGVKTIDMDIDKNHFLGDAAVVVEPKQDGSSLLYRGKAIAKERTKVVAIPVADIKKELAVCSPLMRAWIASFTHRILHVVESLSSD